MNHRLQTFHPKVIEVWLLLRRIFQTQSIKHIQFSFLQKKKRPPRLQRLLDVRESSKTSDISGVPNQIPILVEVPTAGNSIVLVIFVRQVLLPFFVATGLADIHKKTKKKGSRNEVTCESGIVAKESLKNFTTRL